MKNRVIISIFLWLPLCSTALAAEESHEEVRSILKSITLQPGEVKSFTEIKLLSFLDIPITAKGILKLNNDGSLTKYIEDINETLTISEHDLRKTINNEESVFVYSEHNSTHQLIPIIRALFLSDFDTLEQHFSFELTQQEGRWVLRLNPQSRSLSRLLSFITIEGEDNLLEKTEIVQSNGDRITTTFRDASR